MAVTVPARRFSTLSVHLPGQASHATWRGPAAMTSTSTRMTRPEPGSSSLSRTAPGPCRVGVSSSAAPTARTIAYPGGSRTGGPTACPVTVTCRATADPLSSAPARVVVSHSAPAPDPAATLSATPTRVALTAPSAMKYTGAGGPTQSWQDEATLLPRAAQPPGTRVNEYPSSHWDKPANGWKRPV